MAIDSIKLMSVRCLAPTQLALSSDINFITGDNGSGKSSIVEGCLLGLTGKSFRTSKLHHVIQHGSDQSSIQVKLTANQRIHLELFASKNKNRRIRINEQSISSASQLATLCPIQVISPESFHLIDSAPSERRRFIDWQLFHVEHSYSLTWKQYQTALNQRNALLKSGRRKQDICAEIGYWDQQLAVNGEAINSFRQREVNALESELNHKLKDGALLSHSISLDYLPGYRGESLLDALTAGFEQDYQRGYTRHGCHKADIAIRSNNNLVKDILSRGQKKIVINLMYLAQLRLLKQATHKPSVFMIDDFTSELDEQNQKLLLEGLKSEDDLQIIATGLSLDAAKSVQKVYNSGQLFHVERGQVSTMK